MPPSIPRSEHSLPHDLNSPSIPGLRIPDQFYWLRTNDFPLAGMQLPSSDMPWHDLYEYGFRWIVCLCSERPLYESRPIKSLVAIELSDLAEAKLPEAPEEEEQFIQVIADAVVQRLEQGEGVIVHCAGGRGRTGTVLGAALVKMGYPVNEVVSHLNAVHIARGKSGWPESSWQRSVVERSAND